MARKKASEWSKLDNAAKIFPANSIKSDTKVFRFACELKEEVNKDILQKALNITIEDFPLFKSVIKSGLFWYYFERSHIEPLVKEENLPPLSPLFDKNKKDLLFRVMYYRNRISFEVYHALTDGTGALQFLRALVFKYLLIKHADELKGTNPVLDYDASRSQKSDDSFQRYRTENSKLIVKKTKLKKETAYLIKGLKIPEYRLKVIEGVMPVKDIIKLSKDYDTSLTIFLAAILMISISEEMPTRHKKYPVVLNIPVNLRTYFNSETARNFFGVINVSYNFNENSSDLADVIKSVQNSFKENLTAENLSSRINALMSLEQNYLLRAIPLTFKNYGLKKANDIFDKGWTSSLSNVGKVDMPPELRPYISSFDVFVSTNKLQACACSYGDKFRISFTSAFVSSDILRRFFRNLTSLGLNVDIVANKIYEE
ncbi:MAG: hypothetical protein K0Q97_643 [Bacillota bacterium]|jgi:NRPS condensation-like uncharacterized protein|nr:hypothetical protein [Bacillota bacterium]